MNIHFKFSFFNFFILFLIFIFCIICFFLIKNTFFEDFKESQEFKYIDIAGKTLKVELALTNEVQEKGLSGKKALKEDEGMLFVFDHPDKYAFWMKDMNFPIDIIWISDDFRVVHIQKNTLPSSFPQSFVSDTDARYVLEVSALFSEKNNLKNGDFVKIFSSKSL